MQLNSRYKLKQNSDKCNIYNNDGMLIGNINNDTKKLIEYLNSGMSLNEICNIFQDETAYSYNYIKSNMAKIIKFLLANNVLVDEVTNE